MHTLQCIPLESLAPYYNLKPGSRILVPLSPRAGLLQCSKNFLSGFPRSISQESKMSQRESKLSRDIMNELRKAGAYCIKIHGNEYMQVGTPDIMGCYKGRHFAFETKLPEKRSNTSVVQERQMAKIREAGGIAQVVCTPQEALDAMISQSR